MIRQLNSCKFLFLATCIVSPLYTFAEETSGRPILAEGCGIFFLEEIGLLYGKGKGVEQNDEEAIKWYRLAAEQGNEEAQKALELF